MNMRAMPFHFDFKPIFITLPTITNHYHRFCCCSFMAHDDNTRKYPACGHIFFMFHELVWNTSRTWPISFRLLFSRCNDDGKQDVEPTIAVVITLWNILKLLKKNKQKLHCEQFFFWRFFFFINKKINFKRRRKNNFLSFGFFSLRELRLAAERGLTWLVSIHLEIKINSFTLSFIISRIEYSFPFHYNWRVLR